MARRTVLTGRQRSALFSLPQHEADLLRHYTLSDEDLQNMGRWLVTCDFSLSPGARARAAPAWSHCYGSKFGSSGQQ